MSATQGGGLADIGFGSYWTVEFCSHFPPHSMSSESLLQRVQGQAGRIRVTIPLSIVVSHHFISFCQIRYLCLYRIPAAVYLRKLLLCVLCSAVLKVTTIQRVFSCTEALGEPQAAKMLKKKNSCLFTTETEAWARKSVKL